MKHKAQERISMWVDTFKNEIVLEKEKNAPPERYYQYIKGVSDDIIIETYVVSEQPLMLLDFAHLASKNMDDVYMTSIERKHFLREHGISSNARLYSYIVPPTWFNEELEKLL